MQEIMTHLNVKKAGLSIQASPPQVFLPSQLGSLELLRVFVETVKELGSKENIHTLARLPHSNLSVISV